VDVHLAPRSGGFAGVLAQIADAAKWETAGDPGKATFVITRKNFVITLKKWARFAP
jgi:hypothetical protein